MSHHWKNRGSQLYQVKMIMSLSYFGKMFGEVEIIILRMLVLIRYNGLDYLNNSNITAEYLNNVEGKVTGLILGARGHVKKPIQVMQIDDLGKLNNIRM